MRYIHGQDQFSVIHPPRTGPIRGAKITAIPNIAIDFGLSCGGKLSSMIDCPKGKSPPPPSPCKKRARTIIIIELETAHKNDEKVKIIVQIIK